MYSLQSTIYGLEIFLGGSFSVIYVLLERVYTTTSAFIFTNTTLMKLNEYLPWTNFNNGFISLKSPSTNTTVLSQDQTLP